MHLDDVRAAAAAIAGSVERTPCTHSRTLSAVTGAQVFLKFENHQFTAAFKERGALHKLLSLTPEERSAGVVAMSAGNHAQAVAWHARRLGIAATIVMPRDTPDVKVEHTRAFGAEVILHGADLDEATAVVDRLVREKGLTLVHPYDDEKVIAGQGTIALEMLESFPDLEVLVLPIGGGGLIAGNAVAAAALSPGIEIVGVQAERCPSMRQALRGEPCVFGEGSIAEGIAVKQPGRLTLPIVRELVDDILLVDEAALEAAVLLLLEVEKTVVEGAGAAGLAALLAHPERFAGRRVGLVLCGGNIDSSVLSTLILRGLVRSQRLLRVRIAVPDAPGSLAAVTRLLADAGAHVVEVHHHRAFTDLSLRTAELELVLQARGSEHAHEILEALRSAGYGALLHEPEPD